MSETPSPSITELENGHAHRRGAPQSVDATTSALAMPRIERPSWLSTACAEAFDRLAAETFERIHAIMARQVLRSVVENERSRQLPRQLQRNCLLSGVWSLVHALATCIVRSQHDCPLDVEATRIAHAGFLAGGLVRAEASAWADACFHQIKEGTMSDEQTSELEAYFDRSIEAIMSTTLQHYVDCYRNYCPNEKTTQ